MALVFAVHVAEPFNPWDTWHVVNPARSKWLGEIVLFLAPWIMPLFMVLAGESAWHALRKRSSAAYVRERIVRVALPLAAGILVLVPPQVYLERRLYGRFQGSFVEFYPHFFEGIYPRGNFAWHHLWFLAFLLVFAIATVPLFRWLAGPRGRELLARLARPCDAPGGLLWLVAPAVAIRVAVELLFPSVRALAYDWPDRGLLLPAFVAGFVLEAEPGFQRAVQRHWRAALVLAFLSSSALAVWAWPGFLLARLPAPRSIGGAFLWGGYGLIAWCWLVAITGAARCHLVTRSTALERISELVYPFYVLHQTAIVAVAFVVVQWPAGIPMKASVLGTVSFTASAACCWIVSSWSGLRVVFGLRARPSGLLPPRGREA